MTNQGFMNAVNEAMMPNEAKPNEANDTSHDGYFQKNQSSGFNGLMHHSFGFASFVFRSFTS